MEFLTETASVLRGKETENTHKQVKLWGNEQIFHLIQNKDFGNQNNHQQNKYLDTALNSKHLIGLVFIMHII